jgi:hypothetical protein
VPAFSGRMTTATVLASAPRPTRTLTPSISISIIPEVRSTGRARGRCRRLTAPSGNAGSTTAGTNCGASAAASAPPGCRASRRHVNNCCGASPCRRRNFRDYRTRNKRLFNHPGLVVCRKPPPTARSHDHLKPARRLSFRLKRMVKRKHNTISPIAEIVTLSDRQLQQKVRSKHRLHSTGSARNLRSCDQISTICRSRTDCSWTG